MGDVVDPAESVQVHIRRAKQARTIPGPEIQNEIEALHILTQAACSSSPTLLSWKKEKQTPNMWLPSGYIVYILMNKLPGIRIEDVEFLSRQEREKGIYT